MSRVTSQNLALSGALLLGAALRLVAVLAPGSLQWDELATARNAAQGSWTELLLLRPLDQLQVAPFGFMLAEKAGDSWIGHGDLGLRLFPLLVSIAALFLFWRIASRYVSGWTLVGAVALFAVCPALVWYARKVKQYASDVTVVLLLWLLALRFEEGHYEGRRGWIAGAWGGLAILFSQPGLLVGFGVGTVLFLRRWRSRELSASFFRLGAGWGAGAVAQVVSSLLLAPPATREFMLRGWEFAFFPLPWNGWNELLWLHRQLFHFTGFFFGMLRPDSLPEVVFTLAYGLLAGIGLWRLARRWNAATALLLAPLIVALLASALRVLPFAGRLIIYLGPGLVIACAIGLEQITVWTRRLGGIRKLGAGTVVLAPVLLVVPLIFTLVRNEDTRPVLEAVRAEWRSGDAIYVYHGAIPAMAFYGERLKFDSWTVGGPHLDDQRDYLRDIDRLRDRDRVWFFHTHQSRCEPEVIVSYLDAIGSFERRIPDPHGVTGFHQTEAYLYALGAGAESGPTAETYMTPDSIQSSCGQFGPNVKERIKRRLRGLLDRFLP